MGWDVKWVYGGVDWVLEVATDMSRHNHVSCRKPHHVRFEYNGETYVFTAPDKREADMIGQLLMRLVTCHYKVREAAK